MFWVGHQSLQEQPEPPAEMLPNTGKAFPGDLHHCFIKTTQLDRATGCVHADTYTWEEQPAWHGRKQPRAPRDPSEQNRRDGGTGHKPPAIISSCSSGSQAAFLYLGYLATSAAFVRGKGWSRAGRQGHVLPLWYFVRYASVTPDPLSKRELPQTLRWRL